MIFALGIIMFLLIDLDMRVSDDDVSDIAFASKLLHAQLQHLYLELHVDASHIENAQRHADGDYRLEAVRVLKAWRQSLGEQATRRTVIEALEECRFNEAKEKLLDKWTRRSQGKYIYFWA